jgi:hypothetical protein
VLVPVFELHSLFTGLCTTVVVQCTYNGNWDPVQVLVLNYYSTSYGVQ